MVSTDQSLILPAPELCLTQLNGGKMTGFSEDDKPQNTFATSSLVRPSLT